MVTNSRAKPPVKKPATRRDPALAPGDILDAKGFVSVRQLRERFGLSRKLFARALGFSERAIADWEANKVPSEACQQRLRELSRLQTALAEIMRAEFVGTWLNTPNEAFVGLKPLEVIERGEVDRLWRMIYELEAGVPT